jgi:hypothetical protein
MHVTNLS